MEYDCHTMLYIIHKKDEYKKSDVFKFEEIYKKYIENNEYENGKSKDLRINNKNKVKLRILGEYFCRNNKNKGKLIINNKKSELKEFINIENINKEQIKVKMILKENIQNKSYMFENCDSILELKINDNFLQLLHIKPISITLLVFHLDISGNDNNDEQL